MNLGTSRTQSLAREFCIFSIRFCLSFAAVVLFLPCTIYAQQNSPSNNYEVLKSWKADVDGHTIIYNRVAPPVVSGTASTPVMTPEMLQWLQARMQKKYQSVSLFVTVFDHQYSELRWFENGKEYCAFSNIDFNYLTGIGELETSDTIYGFTLFIGNKSSDSIPQESPTRGWLTQARQHLPNLTPTTASSCFMVEGLASDTTVPAAMDVLHAFYDENRDQLIQDYEQKQAAATAQAQQLKEQPPTPSKPTIINFWPKKSTTRPVQ